jgi:hypothetical protein
MAAAATAAAATAAAAAVAKTIAANVLETSFYRTIDVDVDKNSCKEVCFLSKLKRIMHGTSTMLMRSLLAPWRALPP